MTSKKIELSKMPANHRQVIGFAKICSIRGGILRSPMLWNVTLTGKPKTAKYTQWQIYVAIQHSGTKKQLDITVPYILKRKKLPPNYIAVLWTASAQEGGKITASDQTPISTGKSIGNKNETTPFTQAILDARSAFNFKVRKGGVIDKSRLKLPGELYSVDELLLMTYRGNFPWRVFPMALHDVNKTTPRGTSNWKHVTYPGLIQPKFDGTRFDVIQHPKLPIIEIPNTRSSKSEPENTNITKKLTMDGYSRGKEFYDGQDHIFEELAPVLIKYPGLYLDGELFKEGYGLQHISGSSRRQADSKRTSETIKLDYYIFDCFYIDQPELTFEDRKSILDDIQTHLQMEWDEVKYIKFTPDKEYTTKEEAISHFQKYVEQGFEGGVLRNIDSLYKFGLNKEMRSHETLKIKPSDDDEWPVIGFTEGTKGKDVGALKWILTVTPQTVKKHGKKYDNSNAAYPDEPKNRLFDAVSKGAMGDYETRYALFKYLKENPDYFDTNLKGKLMKIQFTNISDYGKPQQPKVLGFRDQRITDKFLHNAGVL